MITIPENSVYILVDVQNSDPSKEPRGNSDKRERYLKNVERVTEYFRERGDVPIVHIREIHRKDLIDYGRELEGAENIHCLEGTPEATYYEPTAPIEGEYTVDKRRYSAFFGTDLEILLRGLKAEHLFLVGGMTDICVHYTAIDAHQYNYHVHVFKEACGTPSSDEVAQAALDNIEYHQAGSIISVEDLFQ